MYHGTIWDVQWYIEMYHGTFEMYHGTFEMYRGTLKYHENVPCYIWNVPWYIANYVPWYIANVPWYISNVPWYIFLWVGSNLIQHNFNKKSSYVDNAISTGFQTCSKSSWSYWSFLKSCWKCIYTCLLIISTWNSMKHMINLEK